MDAPKSPSLLVFFRGDRIPIPSRAIIMSAQGTSIITEKDRFGEQKAIDIANHIEYIWNDDCSKDLFAI